MVSKYYFPGKEMCIFRSILGIKFSWFWKTKVAYTLFELQLFSIFDPLIKGGKEKKHSARNSCNLYIQLYFMNAIHSKLKLSIYPFKNVKDCFYCTKTD